MIPAERDAVRVLSRLDLVGNARMFVAGLAAAPAQELTPIQRGYLLRLASKHGLPTESIQAAMDDQETEIRDRKTEYREGRSGTAREAPSTHRPADAAATADGEAVRGRSDDDPIGGIQSAAPFSEGEEAATVAGQASSPPMLYDQARKALAEAKAVDEIKAIADKAEAVRIYAQRAGNRDMEIDAAEIRLRAERRLGEVLGELKAAEGLSEGGRPRKKTGAETEPVSDASDAPTLADFGIDRKLSARAQKIAGVEAAAFEERLATWRERLANDHVRVSVDIIKAPPVNGGRAVMAGRREDWASLDYAPTPPWATRALTAHVLPAIGVGKLTSVWDPGCGEGHITGVLAEIAEGPVTGTDIHDYSCDGRSPPGWRRVQDFLDTDPALGLPPCDWIVTNPPFKDKWLAFVTRALDCATVGVAMFARVTQLDGHDRYEQLFRDRPPTVMAFFVERVNLCMGRWEPEGSTATAYMWLAWKKGMDPRAPLWIPPGRRQALSLPSDVARFTAHPVETRDHESGIGEPAPATNIPEIIPETESRSDDTNAPASAGGPGERAAVLGAAPSPPPPSDPGFPAFPAGLWRGEGPPPGADGGEAG